MKTIIIKETRKGPNGLKTTVSVNTEDINVARKLLADVVDSNCKNDDHKNTTCNKSKEKKSLLTNKTKTNSNDKNSKGRRKR